MARKRISTGSAMEREAGYSRAIVDGNWCFVSGTTGYNYETMDMPDTLSGQTHNCFSNISRALREAGFDLSDVVRVHYYVNSRAYADEAFPIFGQYLGNIRPAATLIICDLLHPDMKIEIEVTALKNHNPEAADTTDT